ncbi:hypothetical protein BHE74_00008378 [Ensete ventricosum]|uniref:Uncharacterized protein n=1 Tax=Ensete ventricosum TaxID=4639 RepID=A0A427ASR4_ENSVE|nr:hypothetical protein B296_00004319 [Ensete ventricosum]RWW26785.1 hypothetical protein GW17_00008813 [Ensete ventricosum]RWW83130.1 hypothetical protein BHE74_00008378 [Ensete ventricosum]RZR83134.1 hypothetical protein BHM03_00009690 [Ensete ventricosum]
MEDQVSSPLVLDGSIRSIKFSIATAEEIVSICVSNKGMKKGRWGLIEGGVLFVAIVINWEGKVGRRPVVKLPTDVSDGDRKIWVLEFDVEYIVDVIAKWLSPLTVVLLIHNRHPRTPVVLSSATTT